LRQDRDDKTELSDRGALEPNLDKIARDKPHVEAPTASLPRVAAWISNAAIGLVWLTQELKPTLFDAKAENLPTKCNCIMDLRRAPSSTMAVLAAASAPHGCRCMLCS
jgi:hypothetical protein